VENSYQVLLYYKYTPIKHPERVKDEQKELCLGLNLKGRIIIAQEGINGTVEGTVEETETYIKKMHTLPYFKDLNFKKSKGTGNAFPKLSIKVRPEVVRLGIPEVNPNKVSGKYLTSEELHQWFAEGKEFYIVDLRNDYEYESGYFQNSIFAGIHNFYDLPQVLPKLKHLKNKTVVTVCTGGIRCEKGSGLLVLNGFNNVYQLKDGIHTYMEKYPNKYFKGKLYVFDNRLTVGFNTADPAHEIVGKCMHCGKSCDSYVNCAEDFCHYHYICCEDCRDKETGLAFCKKECKEKYLKREEEPITFQSFATTP